MALSYVASTTAVKDSGSGTTITVNVPAVSNGDLMFIAVLNLGSNWTYTSGLTGWTLAQESSGAANAVVRVWQRVASSEPSSYTVTMSSASRALAGIVAYRGYESSNPVNAANNSSSSSAGTTFGGPNVTTSVNDCWLLTAVACRTNSSASSSFTTSDGSDSERMDLTTVTGSSNNAGLALYDSNRNLMSGTYSRTLTDSTTWTHVSAVSLAIQPASLVASGFSGWGMPI